MTDQPTLDQLRAEFLHDGDPRESLSAWNYIAALEAALVGRDTERAVLLDLIREARPIVAGAMPAVAVASVRKWWLARADEVLDQHKENQ